MNYPCEHPAEPRCTAPPVAQRTVNSPEQPPPVGVQAESFSHALDCFKAKRGRVWTIAQLHTDWLLQAGGGFE